MLNAKEQAIVDKWNEFSRRIPSDPGKLRQAVETFFIELNADLPAVGVVHRNVDLRPGLNADIAVPNGSGPHPIAVYIHGGAWIAGSLNTHRKLAMRFAEHGYLTVNVDYRLAPENPFPAGIDDCIFAAKWTAQNASRWNGNSSRMLVAGDSAGANLTAATLLALSSVRDAPGFRAGALIYGVFDFPSFIQDAPARGPVEGMAAAYLGSQYPAALNDPRVSPLHAIKPASLPPCFVICGSADTLLPQSRSIAAALKQAAIEYELQELEDMPHAFMQMEDLSACREGQRLMFDFLRRHV